MSKQTKINIDRSDIMSIMALLLSLGAFYISIKQTGILRAQQKTMNDQQEIMASQLEGSVWPYIKSSIQINKEGETDIIEVILENKGVGPAKIKNFSLKLGDSLIGNDFDLLTIVKNLKIPMRVVRINLPDNRVLSSNEKDTVLKLKTLKDEDDLELLQVINDVRVCYCSIYDKCYGNCED